MYLEASVHCAHMQSSKDKEQFFFNKKIIIGLKEMHVFFDLRKKIGVSIVESMVVKIPHKTDYTSQNLLLKPHK